MSKKKPKLRLVSIDDWCALYLDGKSIYQGHSLELDRFFAVLEENGVSTCLDFSSRQGSATDENKAHDLGNLPDYEEELEP
jgi:hypothetical protein